MTRATRVNSGKRLYDDDDDDDNDNNNKDEEGDEKTEGGWVSVERVLIRDRMESLGSSGTLMKSRGGVLHNSPPSQFPEEGIDSSRCEEVGICASSIACCSMGGRGSRWSS